jgi:hypothetical protein
VCICTSGPDRWRWRLLAGSASEDAAGPGTRGDTDRDAEARADAHDECPRTQRSLPLIKRVLRPQTALCGFSNQFPGVENGNWKYRLETLA